MAFTRQAINNTSTFSVNGETEEQINIPTFRRWENVTREIKWDLGRGWTLNVPNDKSAVVFNLNGNDVFTIQSTGTTADPILELENYATSGDIPSTYATAGLLARINGELFVSQTLQEPS